MRRPAVRSKLFRVRILSINIVKPSGACCQILPSWLRIRLLRLTWAWTDITWNMLEGSHWISNWTSRAATITSATTRLSANQTWGWGRQTESRTWCSHQITISWSLFPLLEAIITNPNPIPVFLTTLEHIGRQGNRVRRALSTENPPTQSTMMSAIKNIELAVTLVAHAAALVWHPEIPGHVCRFWASGLRSQCQLSQELSYYQGYPLKYATIEDHGYESITGPCLVVTKLPKNSIQ